MVNNKTKVVIVDDAAYTGKQLDTLLTSVEQIAKPDNIHVFLGASTSQSNAVAQQRAIMNPGESIPTINDLLQLEEPVKRAELERLIEEMAQLHTIPSPNSFSGQSLTITDSVPDFESFPHFVSIGYVTRATSQSAKIEPIPFIEIIEAPYRQVPYVSPTTNLNGTP